MDPASSVSKFRILAVQAEPPEAQPGETVTLTTLTADPKGDGREISYLWLTCLGLMNPSSGASGCTTPLNFQLGKKSDGADVYTVTVPPNALDEMPEGETFMQATTVVVLCGGGTLPEMDELVSMDPTEMNFDDLCKDGDNLVTFKTFRISNLEAGDENRNTNPVFPKFSVYHPSAALSFNGNPLPPNDPATGKPTDTTISTEAGSSKCKNIQDCADAEVSKPNTFYCDTLSKCLDGVNIYAFLTENSFQFYDKEVLGEITKTDEAPYISWFVDGGQLNQDRSRARRPDRGPCRLRAR